MTHEELVLLLAWFYQRGAFDRSGIIGNPASYVAVSQLLDEVRVYAAANLNISASEAQVALLKVEVLMKLLGDDKE